MISPQAKVVKRIVKATVGKKDYDEKRVSWHRKKFERNVKALFPSASRARVQKIQVAGIPVTRILPRGPAERTIIYLHGGGFVFGSPRTHQQHLLRLARFCKAEVLAIEYSLAPEYPYPAALNEVQEVWKALLADETDPADVVFIGDSAGGNLVVAACMKFRESGIPQPSALVLLSPALDATLSGASYDANRHTDPMLNMSKLKFFMSSYAGSAAKDSPLISPVFADLSGLPPLLVHAGSDELLLSDAKTIVGHAKRDKVDADIHIGEGMWHGWHLFAPYVPEGKYAMKAVAEYVISKTSKRTAN